MRTIKIPASPAGTAGRKIRNIIILFFSLILTLAVFSQISVANLKPTSDVGFGSKTNPSDWLYYKSNGGISAYLGKKSSTLPTVRYQKDGDYLQFSLNNVSSTTSVSLETNVKTPNTPTLFYRNAFNDTDIAYQITNIPFRVKEEIVLQSKISNLKSKNLTFIFSAETTGKPSKQKDGSIAFFGNKGEYLFQLDKPFMVDAKGIISNEVSIEIIQSQISNLKSKIYNSNQKNLNFQSSINDSIFKPILGIFSSLKIDTCKFIVNCKLNENWKLKIENSASKQYTITLSASSAWLSTATYPVIIDPTVTHNADANFTGQFNRVADSDTTSSTQLESSYLEATKDPYTVLLLHFNETNGTTVGITDMASSARVITANGNASTTSAVKQLGLGNSAAFDGTGDYLSAPDDASLDFAAADNFTIDFWFKHNTIATNPDYAITKADATTGGYKVYMDASGDMCFDIDDDATWTPDDSACTSGVDYDNDVWHHVAGVKTGTTKIELFVDGLLVASDSALAASATLANTNGFYVGMDRDGSSNGWDGKIDEVRVVSRALTPEEIKAAASRRPYAVYTSPVIDATTASAAWNTLNWTEGGVNTGNGEQPYSTNSLVAQWDFNDTSGATLTASSSGSCTTACNGTLTGFSYTASQDQATTTTGWTANNKKWGAGALMFDGVDDYVQATSPTGIPTGNSARTVEAWIKNNGKIDGGVGGVYQPIIAWGDAGANNQAFMLEFGGESNERKLGVVGWNNDLFSNTLMNYGQWHYVAATFDGTTLKLYIDGIEDKSGSKTYNTTLNANGVRVGGSTNPGADAYHKYFNGIIDSTRIYSRALSPAEILSNYNAGNIEIQTRTGATSDPNDGTWEVWKPTTGENQLLSLDSDAANWHSDIMASTTIATSTETTIKAEGTGSLKIRTGMASTTAGTVALWHMEETGTTTGTYLYDSTANANNATTTGTTVVDGIFGKARSFNGTSDYLSALDSENWNFGSGDFSIDFWTKFSAVGRWHGFYSQIINGSNYVWFGFRNDLNVIEFQSISGGVGKAHYRASWTPSVNTWYHLSLVRSGSVIYVFVDGVSQSVTEIGPIGILPDLNVNIAIGAETFNGIYLYGNLDEFRILKGRALSPDEIAETYRMGANHHLTRQVSAADLSGANKLPFYVAADRPGTYLEVMLGESDYANYELASSTATLSANTVLYIKGDEIASSTSIKDSSFSGKAITVNGDAKTVGNGKIGNAIAFDGTGDYLSLADSPSWDLLMNENWSMDLWVKDMNATNPGVYSRYIEFLLPNGNLWKTDNCGSCSQLYFYIKYGPGDAEATGFINGIKDTNWHHVAVVNTASLKTTMYLDGVPVGATTFTRDFIGTGTLYLGYDGQTGAYFTGYLDELRIIKGTALTADQIRQAYEYGLRSHQITIDFGASLQPSNLISSGSDYSFAITATTSGLSATTSGLYLGDTIIVKENRGGTESVAQGVVNSINTDTGAVTVSSLSGWSGSIPSGGFTENATVFKWQREYFDLGGALSTHRDAITNLTLRPTNGAGGRTIYLDDFRHNTNYLTASSSSAITSSNGRYLQYRAIFSSTDTFVSPFLTAFNTLYTALANSFPSLIGVSGGGFLSF